MQFYRIDPMEFPLVKGESWWLINPNDGECQLEIPVGAAILCTINLKNFIAGTNYRIVGKDDNHGWISIECDGDIVEIPRYVTARYFDIEPFVKGKQRPLATIGEVIGEINWDDIKAYLNRFHDNRGEQNGR